MYSYINSDWWKRSVNVIFLSSFIGSPLSSTSSFSTSASPISIISLDMSSDTFQLQITFIDWLFAIFIPSLKGRSIASFFLFDLYWIGIVENFRQKPFVLRFLRRRVNGFFKRSHGDFFVAHWTLLLCFLGRPFKPTQKALVVDNVPADRYFANFLPLSKIIHANDTTYRVKLVNSSVSFSVSNLRNQSHIRLNKFFSLLFNELSPLFSWKSLIVLCSILVLV